MTARKLVLLFAAVCALCAVAANTHRYTGRMDASGKVAIKRACPCDSLKDKKVWRFP
jgi:hypothetical protein